MCCVKINIKIYYNNKYQLVTTKNWKSLTADEILYDSNSRIEHKLAMQPKVHWLSFRNDSSDLNHKPLKSSLYLKIFIKSKKLLDPCRIRIVSYHGLVLILGFLEQF